MLDTKSIQQVIESSAQRMMRHQRGDGAFSYLCEVQPLPDALMVILLCLIGLEDDPVVPPLCQSLLKLQRPNGSWSVIPDDTGDLSATTLALFALRLAGFPEELPQLQQAQKFIRGKGGIAASSNLAKIILATAGELPWQLLPHSHVEFIYLGPSSPLSVFDFASFTRLHMPQYMVLRHLEFHYRMPADRVLGNLLLPQDTNHSLSDIPLKIQFDAALAKCEEFILERMEPNGTLAGYLTSTVFAVFAFQALGGYPASHPLIKRAVHGLKELVFQNGKALRQQLFASTVWDTSLCLQALEATSLPFCAKPVRDGVRYLLAKQHRKVSDWHFHAPNLQPGGWGFSHTNTLYPDIDDTIAALKALYPFRSHIAKQWQKGVDFVLGLQNGDGGWGAFEKDVDKEWLERLSINDMGQAMTDPSTPDMTGRVLETLAFLKVDAPEAKEKAVEWLVHHQEQSGSWKGRWAISYIYGTWAAVAGLCGAGLPLTHNSIVNAIKWLHTIQNPDGGFGESCKSELRGKYISLGRSTPSQTAWALRTMITAAPEPTPQIDAAAKFLLDTAHPRGGWRERYPTGSGVQGQAYIRYHSYPQVWPMLALCEYLRKYSH